jgi:hypothetical protein
MKKKLPSKFQWLMIISQNHTSRITLQLKKYPIQLKAFMNWTYISGSIYLRLWSSYNPPLLLKRINQYKVNQKMCSLLWISHLKQAF